MMVNTEVKGQTGQQHTEHHHSGQTHADGGGGEVFKISISSQRAFLMNNASVEIAFMEVNKHMFVHVEDDLG